MAQAGEKSGSSARPSDMFYDKIIPALKEQGITRVTSRKEWPHEVLKQVFSLLVSETPRDLISREIWCSCLSPSELWSKTNMHARSMAVMRMVGYVIGLGDRHLDNILMDFESGEVVHIDWNVCFEKGSKLKVMLCEKQTILLRFVFSCCLYHLVFDLYYSTLSAFSDLESNFVCSSSPWLKAPPCQIPPRTLHCLSLCF